MISQKIKILAPLADLLENHDTCTDKKWQSISISDNNPLVEISDIFIKDLYLQPDLIEYTSPDLPWAEDHFQERINGQPINPGEQYRNWPYYKGLDNDDLFRKEGEFSHNYMERYWCSSLKGRRFQYGDLNDIIERIKDNPYTRQAYLSVWHPEDQSNHGERVPCTLGYWFKSKDGVLNMTYHIRSCDAIRHYRNDLYMSYRLLQQVADETGLQPGYMNIWIGSLHCFKSDLYQLKKIAKDVRNIN